MNNYNRKIANIISEFLTEKNVNHEFDNQEGIFTFKIHIKDQRLGDISYIVLIREHGYIILSSTQLHINPENESIARNLNAFINCANYNFIYGNFEYEDYAIDNENYRKILFKTYAEHKNNLPSADEFFTYISMHYSMFEDFKNSFIAIIAGCSATDACTISGIRGGLVFND